MNNNFATGGHHGSFPWITAESSPYLSACEPLTPASPQSSTQDFSPIDCGGRPSGVENWVVLNTPSPVFTLGPYDTEPGETGFFTAILRRPTFQDYSPFDYPHVPEASPVRKDSAYSTAFSDSSGTCGYTSDPCMAMPCFTSPTQSPMSSKTTDSVSAWPFIAEEMKSPIKMGPSKVVISHDGIIKRNIHGCDYRGCNKSFKRAEHLKRHKQVYHSEGPNRFSCEFCGKSNFNRFDNLRIHRKLHTRRNKNNRGVEFVPQAAAIIDQEDLTRKRRKRPSSTRTKA
ncbi:hypothetical protein HG530_014759 [Fusarium avenaceum]|nr:hypothetical protein HG530_014759 [Fusarium avenaceum]